MLDRPSFMRMIFPFFLHTLSDKCSQYLLIYSRAFVGLMTYSSPKVSITQSNSSSLKGIFVTSPTTYLYYVVGRVLVIPIDAIFGLQSIIVRLLAGLKYFRFLFDPAHVSRIFLFNEKLPFQYIVLPRCSCSCL